MSSGLDNLRRKFHLNITAPFTVEIEGHSHQFQCLISGYGGEKGMIVDADWKKISPVNAQLVAMGFGYSCFDIEAGDVEGFQEVLNDWGKSNT